MVTANGYHNVLSHHGCPISAVTKPYGVMRRRMHDLIKAIV